MFDPNLTPLLLVITAILALSVALLAFIRAILDHLRFKSEIAELRSKATRLEKLLNMRNNLAAEVAHEIRNPLTAILCSAEALDMMIGDTISDSNRTSLKYIREYGDNLLRLVNDFLDISRLESCAVKRLPEPINIVPAIESVVGLLDSNAKRKKITVELDYKSQDIRVFVDPRHIKQVLFNLVHNAIKYTDEGGNVRVKVEPEEDTVRVSVIDNGQGIPQDKLSSLFSLCSRYENEAYVSDGGLGIGLSLVKSLLDIEGGVIDVDSKMGEGTAFKISLPSYNEKIEPLPLNNISFCNKEEGVIGCLDKPLLGKSYLVVEPDPGVGDSIVKLIEAWGGVADQVSEAAKAVEALSNFSYDAVVADPKTAEEIGGEKRVLKPTNGKALLKNLLSHGEGNL